MGIEAEVSPPRAAQITYLGCFASASSGGDLIGPVTTSNISECLNYCIRNYLTIIRM